MRQTDREYAEALFSLCVEEDMCETALADMRTVRELILENPEYSLLLASPAIPLSERLSAIDEAFLGKICDYCVYFLKLLCEKGRISVLLDAIGEFEDLCTAYQGKTEALITSAVELSEEQKAALLEKLEKANKKIIVPIYKVDPAIMGGILVEMDGRVYDGTLKSRLRDVKEVMLYDETQRDQ